MISFKPLQKLLIDRDISKSDFVDMIGISPTTSAKMWKGEYVAMKIIDDICEKLECDLTDVIEYVPKDMIIEKSSSRLSKDHAGKWNEEKN